jgi:N-acetylglucosamine-6-phosphate deacetylase
VDLSGADLAEEEVVRLCRELQQAGTTAFLPTLITSSTDRYRRNLPIIADVMDKPEFQMQMLGIHLEGPFISPHDGARGAHNAEWTRMPDADFLERLIDWAHGKVKMLTLAADLDGAAELAQYATNRGITVALGHHTANEQQLANLVRAGATALTHLGNGIPAMLPRHDNAIWAGLANDELSATLIADGHHLPPSLLKTMIRAKGPERCILISDATALAGMPPGEYESMDARVVLEEDGLLHNPATGYLAGSSATLLACANHLASLDLVTTRELVAMVFDNPLKLLGINPGKIRGESEILFDERRRRFLQEQNA